MLNSVCACKLVYACPCCTSITVLWALHLETWLYKHAYISHMWEGKSPPTIYCTYKYVSSAQIIVLEYVCIFASQHTPVKTKCICFAQDIHPWICQAWWSQQNFSSSFLSLWSTAHAPLRQNPMHILHFSQFSGESAQAWWQTISVINFVGQCTCLTIEFTGELLPPDLPCACEQNNSAVNFCKRGDVTLCDNQCTGQFSGERLKKNYLLDCIVPSQRL